MNVMHFKKVKPMGTTTNVMRAMGVSFVVFLTVSHPSHTIVKKLKDGYYAESPQLMPG